MAYNKTIKFSPSDRQTLKKLKKRGLIYFDATRNLAMYRNKPVPVLSVFVYEKNHDQ